MKVLLIFLGGILIGLLLIGTGYYLGIGRKNPSTQNLVVSITPQLTPTPENPKNEPEPVATGTIEGSIGFPSEIIPGNLNICAENTQTEQTLCTSTQITDKKYTYGVGYNLEVPTGTYFVYAKLPDQEYQAYYSEFVTCGLSVNCKSHNPIEVSVLAGKTTSRVDPQDWYNR